MIKVSSSRARGKSPRPSPADARRLKRQFGDYLDAVLRGKFSEAIRPRNDLAAAGFVIFHRPRRGGGR